MARHRLTGPRAHGGSQVGASARERPTLQLQRVGEVLQEMGNRFHGYPLQRHMWGLPSGKVEADETPLAAAQRELAEEAGVEATEWLPLGTYDLSPGIMTQVSHIFLARGLRDVAARPEGTERFTLRTLPLREALDACLRGELRSAVTVLGIWRAWAYLHGIG